MDGEGTAYKQILLVAREIQRQITHTGKFHVGLHSGFFKNKLDPCVYRDIILDMRRRGIVVDFWPPKDTVVHDGVYVAIFEVVPERFFQMVKEIRLVLKLSRPPRILPYEFKYDSETMDFFIDGRLIAFPHRRGTNLAKRLCTILFQDSEAYKRKWPYEELILLWDRLYRPKDAPKRKNKLLTQEKTMLVLCGDKLCDKVREETKNDVLDFVVTGKDYLYIPKKYLRHITMI